MNTLLKLTDDSLLRLTKELANREREITLQVLHHLREVERRQLFAKIGYSSLFEYAVKELLYSEGSAQRRISSMRLLRSLEHSPSLSVNTARNEVAPLRAGATAPSIIEAKIQAGTLALSTLSQAQSFFRQEKITEPQKKIALLEKLEGQSTRAVEKILAGESAHPESARRESLRAINAELHQLSITLDSTLLEKINELKTLLSNRNSTMSIKDIFEFAVDESLKRYRMKAPKVGSETSLPPAPAVKSRYIPIEIKRRVWARDGGCCTYIHPQSGNKCLSRHRVEFDHIKAFAQGGETIVENLRLRCAAHNRLAAIQSFGVDRIRPFVQAMQ